MEATTILLTALVLLVTYCVWTTRRPKRFPPGPALVPVLGNILSLQLPLHEFCNQLADKYGPVFSLYIGSSYKVVILNKYSVIRKALVDNSVLFAGRPHYPYRMQHYNPQKIGLSESSYCQEWKSQRGVVMSLMRSIGYGKHTTEEKIRCECGHLLSTLRATNVAPYDPTTITKTSVTNVVCFFLFGERFDYKDEQFNRLLNLTSDFNVYYGKDSEGDMIVPLRLLPSHQRSLKRFIQACQGLNNFFADRIQRSQQAMRDEDGQPANFIVTYLREIEKAKAGESKLTENWIHSIVHDFFVAGSDTISSTLMWAMAYMVKYPHVQQKVQQEIDQLDLSEADLLESVGSTGEQVVPLSMRSKLPYVEATLLEIQRYAALLVFAVPHATMEDIELEGCLLPKNTEVWVNLYQVSRDPDLWDNPEEFRPQRFLNDEGEVVKPEYWVPFSMGRRACLGEQLARQELFIFFTSIMRTFTLCAEDTTNSISTEARDSNIFLRIINPYQIRFVPRNTH